jgi:hypothetical protein
MKLRIARKIVQNVGPSVRCRVTTWRRAMKRWDKYNTDIFWTVDWLNRMAGGPMFFIREASDEATEPRSENE